LQNLKIHSFTLPLCHHIFALIHSNHREVAFLFGSGADTLAVSRLPGLKVTVLHALTLVNREIRQTMQKFRHHI